MARVACIVPVMMLVMGGWLAAHHSYSAYERTPIDLEGVIEDIQWVNPHVLFTLTAADAVYTLEWRAVTAIERLSDARRVLAVGDRVVITGRPREDVAVSGLVLLQSIQRPADGWSWPVR